MPLEKTLQAELDSIFQLWLSRAAGIGACVFIFVGILDYVSTPENFVTFMIYRIVGASLLVAIAVAARKFKTRNVIYALGYLAIVSSAIIIELMILQFGGHRSTYYAGHIILAICALGFLPASTGFHIANAGFIYSIYLFPILLFEPITDFRLFFTHNFFLFSVLGIGILMRHLSHGYFVREIRLRQDLDRYEEHLETQVVDRTAKLTEAVRRLEGEISERKKVELALKRAAEEWQSTFDSTRDPVILLDGDHRIVKANNAADSFFGKSVSEIVGRDYRDLLRESGLPAGADSLWPSKRSHGRIEEEYRLAAGNRWVLVSMDAVPGDDHEVAGAVCILKDITESKTTQATLQHVLHEWEETFDTINDAITIHDSDFNILLANKAAEELLNRSLSTIKRKKCFESYHGTDRPPEGCPSCETLKTGEPCSVEVFEPHVNKYIEIKALPRFDDKRNIIGLIHVVRDISERKSAEQEVRKSLDRMRDILENAPFGIYVVNREGTIEYSNPAMVELSVEDHPHYAGIHVLGLPTYREHHIAERIEAALRGEPFLLGPVEYISHLSRQKTIRKYIGVPLEEGTEKKVLVFVEDLTVLRKTEEERQELRTQFIQAQKMESIGRLAGGVAHDFNNILSAMLGYSELALRKLPPEHPARDAINVIATSAEKASSLTRQLLAFSRRQVLEMKVINLKNTVENMEKMLRRMVREDIELVFLDENPAYSILADPSQVEQVIMNLTVNAADAMPSGGKIIVATSEISVDAEYARTHRGLKTGTYGVLSVIDTGDGIPAEMQGRIFEPFFTTKEMGKGTGLGLATVYGIVKQHDGYIEVQSELGKGTTFKVYFQIAGEIRKDLRTVSNSPFVGGTERILVVEDDKVVREVVLDLLVSIGYKVFQAANGREALHMILEGKEDFDLLLTDVIMPEMNGMELAVKARAKKPEIKIVFMSGYTDDAMELSRTLESGMHFIRKPLKPSALTRTLREAFDQKEEAGP